MNKPTLSLLAALALAVTPTLAQTLKSIKVDPAAPRVGEAVTVSAQFDLTDNPNCGVHLHFGDGATTTAKVNQAKDATITATHAYAKAGAYTVMVEPKRVGGTLKCMGANQKSVVTVAAAAAAAPAPGKPAAAAAAVAPACPAGWALDGKSVNKKTGAFQCSAKAGMAAPAARIDCPGSLTYFENTKKGQLGCRP